MKIPLRDEQAAPNTQKPREEKEDSAERKPDAVSASTDVNNNAAVDKQVNASQVGVQHNYFQVSEVKSEISFEQLPVPLDELPPNMHEFRDPRHDQLVSDLQTKRVLLLTSYREHAAYAAAYSLVTDSTFVGHTRQALFPTRGREREREGFDLMALTQDKFLDKKNQIVLIEINKSCTLFESTLELGSGALASARGRLKATESFLVLAVNEELVDNAAAVETLRTSFSYYAVSHLRYLLSKDHGDRAEEYEKRLLSGFRAREPRQLQELYQRVADRLPGGESALETLIQELERPTAPRVDVRASDLAQARDLLRNESALHRAAAFLATYFADLRQHDFDRLLVLLLGDQKFTKERTRLVAGKDGFPTTVSEESEERWSNQWSRDADGVFRDCHLRVVGSPDGSWIVDFSEPHLRRELRAHFEGQLPWYLRRQCRTLQESGILFATDLSPSTVEGLVALFVERAVVDPVGFGSGWLLNLVRGMRIQLSDQPPSDSSEETLVWLLAQLATRGLLAHFRSRLAFLIRAMLERDELRPMVGEFFESLIATRQHEALLSIIVDLARRLRFVPHFEPLAWMRRLLDQGTNDLRNQAANLLVVMARESGPRIYGFLAGIRRWLPDAGTPSKRFSCSNRTALEFPFAYCAHIAGSLLPERLGAWPSQHPLFYTLPADADEARAQIASFIAWILDARGADGAAEETLEPSQPAREARIGQVADLVEHWWWVLQGGSPQAAPECRDLFVVILEEILRRIGAPERSWFQRSWQQSQDDCLREAAAAGATDIGLRTFLVARRDRLTHLRTHFAEIAKKCNGGTTT